MNRSLANLPKELLSKSEANLGIKYHANTDKVNVIKDTATYRAERELNLSHLKDLLSIFKKTADPETGKINFENFKYAFSSVLSKGLTDEQLSIIFMKIDMDTDNYINWDDFSSFMLLRSEGQKHMLEEIELNLFETLESQSTSRNNATHKEMIIKVQHIPSMKRIMTCCREGTICYWNEDLKLQRKFLNAGQLFNERKNGFIDKIDGDRIFEGTNYRWINDAVLMVSLQKIALATDDHQITFYERCLCLDLQNMNALSLDIYLAPNPSESLLLYSTDSGYVNCLTFNEDQMVKMTARQKGRVEHIFLEKESSMKKIKMLGTLWMRKAHGDWALKVKYIPELRAIVSCSPDLNESLVVAELDNNHKWQFHVSPVHKGVSCFSYCKSPAIIATGGLDRQVRLWNPHKLNHPRAILKGHVAPIIDLSSNANHGQIISLSSDKVVKVWDISKQVCLQTINNTLIQTPDDTLSTISFINGSHQLSLITTSNMLFRYKHNLALKKQGNNPKSHEQPVRCILYNSIFNQIVTGCDGGVVNVWDFSSGAKTFRFVINDGNVEITTMCFDSQGRRLITGLRDGRIQIWNFNNGELLQELRKGNDCEVTKIIYVPVKDTSYIIATGWDKKVIMFVDDAEAAILYPVYTWPNSSKKGPKQVIWHQDDILSMEFCPPDLIATSSYTGNIVILSLQSGHLLYSFNPHDDRCPEFPAQQKSIDKLLYLRARSLIHPQAASLISAGGDGTIRFWNVNTGQMYLEMDCTHGKNESIYSIATDSNNSLLITGDSAGWISVYDIKEAGIGLLHKSSARLTKMPLLHIFQAHTLSIVDVALLEPSQIILTCSLDCSVRLFTIEGHFIGILGQNSIWDIAQKSTFAHPFLPWDIQKQGALKIKKYAEKLKNNHNSSREATPPGLKNYFPALKYVNADSTNERSWFAKSIYAHERFTKKSRNYDLNIRITPNLSGAYRIYNYLKPQELREFGEIKKNI